MSTGKAHSWSGVVVIALVAVTALVAAGCGGGGSSSGKAGDDGKDLWVERFSVPNFSGILLDESVSLVFSAKVKANSLNHDSIQFRTGPQGGQAPRGSFVRGSFLFDPISGTRVVIDPDPIGTQQIDKIQKKGRLDLVPDEIRYDLGFASDLNGSRMVLVDNSQGQMVTFIPEVPTRLDLSDSGYQPGATYTVVVPSFPETNTVLSVEGTPVVERDGRIFVSSFTTVPITSPFLFLGGENAGLPRVVNSSPADSQGGVEPDARIFVRFSQPLDPRTVTPDNFFLNLVSVAGRPQLEVSLFLRQSRAGLVEVVMTPLSDLPPNHWYEVTISQGVRDLLGAVIPPGTKFSFSTSGSVPPPTDIVETFSNNSQEETTLTSANWNGTKPYVGSVPGALTASYSPFAGSGVDGKLDPTVGDITLLDTGTTSPNHFNYTEIDVAIGATVIGQGSYGLVLRSQSDVSIAGLIDVGGLSGGTGQTGSAGDTDATGGAGGAGGAGGFDGGDGAMTEIGAAGNFDGIDGDGDGGGNGGGTGDQEEQATPDSQPPNAARMREAGGGGGHATAGGDADYANFKGKDGGRGGGTYGEGDFTDAPLVPPIVGVPTLTLGFGGSGGGGGGGEDDHPDPTNNPNPPLGDGKPGAEDEGGGGGGGGGGALQITAYGSISVSGRLAANGGQGGRSFNESTGGLGQGAAGGGGAGGSIWLQSFAQITLDALAQIEALGGFGGLGDSITNRAGLDKQQGGDGGDGYIRLEDADGSIIVPGTVTPQGADLVGEFTPLLALASFAQSRWYNQFFTTPNYGAVEVDSALNGGTILVEVQGSREDVNQGGTQPVDPDLDPERTNTTDWVPIIEIDRLDNFQYLRFRVFFTVDPLQDFTDPLPVIDEVRIPVIAGG